MLEQKVLYRNAHGTFDNICNNLEGGNSSLVIYPAGSFTQICLSNIDKIDSILCLGDRNVKERNICGYPVKTIEEIVKEHDNFKVLILSNIYYEDIKREWLRYIPEQDIFPCINFDTRVHFNYFEEQYRKWLRDKRNLISFVYESLSDDISKESFFLMLLGAEHYSASELMSICSVSPTEDPDYFHEYDFMRLSDDEDYLDVGAYDGDTVRSFIQASQGKYNSITAIEPDRELFQQLENNCREMNDEKINCLCVGLGDSVFRAKVKYHDNKYMNSIEIEEDGELEVQTIDSLNRTISLIKVSVYDQQCRLNIIKGGEKVLLRDRPKLIVQVERQTDDILNIPYEILKINSDYKIYFRIMLYEQKGMLRFNMAYWAV